MYTEAKIVGGVLIVGGCVLAAIVFLSLWLAVPILAAFVLYISWELTTDENGNFARVYGKWERKSGTNLSHVFGLLCVVALISHLAIVPMGEGWKQRDINTVVAESKSGPLPPAPVALPEFNPDFDSATAIRNIRAYIAKEGKRPVSWADYSVVFFEGHYLMGSHFDTEHARTWFTAFVKENGLVELVDYDDEPEDLEGVEDTTFLTTSVEIDGSPVKVSFFK